MAKALVDIGNSSVKYMVINSAGKIEHTGRKNNISLAMNKVLTFAPRKVYFSSVKFGSKEDIAIKAPNLPSFEINFKSNLDFQISYDNPERLGADRICAIEGGLVLFNEKSREFKIPETLITVDFGTATTINVVHEGVFIGGIIAPGVKTMLRSLYTDTAVLPMLNEIEGSELIGKSTTECMTSGVVFSAVGLVNHYIFMLRKEGFERTAIYCTGGNYIYVSKYLNFRRKADLRLNLLGLKRLSEIN